MPRQKIPNAIKKTMGNPGKIALAKLEDGVHFNESEDFVFAPADLIDEELDKWNELAPLLFNAKVFTEGDREILAQYCRYWRMYVQAIADQRVHGSNFDTGKGDLKVAPWTQVILKVEPRLHAILSKFGMNPVDRSRANLVQKEEKANKAERFFN